MVSPKIDRFEASVPIAIAWSRFAGNEIVCNSVTEGETNKKGTMRDVFTDAIALLKADHRAIKDLFRQFDHTRSASRRKALAQQICSEAKIHLLVEEDAFSSFGHGNKNSDCAKMLLREIETALENGIPFTAMVAALSRHFEQHIHEQESLSEGLFATSRKSDLDLHALQPQIKARKEELLVQLKSDGPAAAQPVRLALLTAA